MSAGHAPADELLGALRRLAADAPISRRFPPAEWLKVAKDIGLSDAQVKEAISSLEALGHIQFMPQSTQIIALTQEGVTAADALVTRGRRRQVNEPMPDTLEAIRADLDHWEMRLYDGDPRSNWWEQVQARIDGLRHRENRLLSIQAPVTITNNAFGPNSRFNQNSIDQSTNQVETSLEDKGYEAADHLEGFARWSVESIVLRAHYMYASSEEHTLSCKAVVAIPARYFADHVGADGTVMRSVKEPRSLLVEGTEPSSLGSWTPNEVEFVDTVTGGVERFRIDGMQFLPHARLKLPLAG